MRRRARIAAIAWPLIAVALLAVNADAALAGTSSLRPTVPPDGLSVRALATALLDSTTGTAAAAHANVAALGARIDALRAEDASVRVDLAALDPAAAGRDPYLGRLLRDAISASADGGRDASALSVSEQVGGADVIAERATLVSRDATLGGLSLTLSDAASRTTTDLNVLEAARSAALALGSPSTSDPAAGLAQIDALTAQVARARVALASDSAVTVGVPLAPIAPWTWPVAGTISQGFGPTSIDLEAPRVYAGIAFPYFHDAVDIAAPLGSPVVAAAGGTVTFVGRFSDGAMVVQITSPDGLQETYAHLDDLASPPPVKVNSAVAAGQRIGTVGLTGITTGPHLHFSVYRGTTPVDPLPLLPPRG
ncbi:MAG: M23 family metallopeptidase [Chloroflexota bacterium]|nr:M23 family metallopeptidase [Chloroflexota bacterium]